MLPQRSRKGSPQIEPALTPLLVASFPLPECWERWAIEGEACFGVALTFGSRMLPIQSRAEIGRYSPSECTVGGLAWDCCTARTDLHQCHTATLSIQSIIAPRDYTMKRSMYLFNSLRLIRNGMNCFFPTPCRHDAFVHLAVPAR